MIVVYGHGSPYCILKRLLFRLMPKGGESLADHSRWIPETTTSWRYYRHLLAGPYRIYSAHRGDPSRAILVLCGPLGKPGDIVEQLASRLEYITNPSILEAAATLYFDHGRRKPKSGAASRNGKGTIRRFIDVIGQFDVTWDLYSLNPGSILKMLPSEFFRFLNGTANP